MFKLPTKKPRPVKIQINQPIIGDFNNEQENWVDTGYLCWAWFDPGRGLQESNEQTFGEQQVGIATSYCYIREPQTAITLSVLHRLVDTTTGRIWNIAAIARVGEAGYWVQLRVKEKQM